MWHWIRVYTVRVFVWTQNRKIVWHSICVYPVCMFVWTQYRVAFDSCLHSTRVRLDALSCVEFHSCLPSMHVRLDATSCVVFHWCVNSMYVRLDAISCVVFHWCLQSTRVRLDANRVLHSIGVHTVCIFVLTQYRVAFDSCYPVRPEFFLLVTFSITFSTREWS